MYSDTSRGLLNGLDQEWSVASTRPSRHPAVRDADTRWAAPPSNVESEHERKRRHTSPRGSSRYLWNQFRETEQRVDTGERPRWSDMISYSVAREALDALDALGPQRVRAAVAAFVLDVASFQGRHDWRVCVLALAHGRPGVLFAAIVARWSPFPRGSALLSAVAEVMKIPERSVEVLVRLHDYQRDVLEGLVQLYLEEVEVTEGTPGRAVGTRIRGAGARLAAD